MQQFDEIKRMSDLARQLRERGLAKDSLDALNQAKSVTSSDPAVQRERKEAQEQERIALLERKNESLQRQLDECKARLETTDKRFAELLRQMDALNGRLRNAEAAAAASTASLQPIPQQPAPQQWNQAYPPQVEVAAKPAATAPIDRNGVAPADVSVEKFFYFGNKR